MFLLHVTPRARISADRPCFPRTEVPVFQRIQAPCESVRVRECAFH